jgi:hypothetical protein
MPSSPDQGFNRIRNNSRVADITVTEAVSTE